MSFTAKIQALIDWKWEEGTEDSDTISFAKILADGNELNEAEAIWHKESVELLDAASETFDLTALIRTILGDDTHTTTFLLIKAILIVNESTTGGQLLLGGAGSNEWSEPFGADGDIAKVPLNSPRLLANYGCGWEVDNSNRNLKLAASGGDVTYSIAIIGTITTTVGDCSSSGL